MSKKPQSTRKYAWRPGKHFAVDAQQFGEFVESLPDKRPESIVDAARNPKSVAHPLFEWNDSRAAQEFRLVQARSLYGSLEVDVIIYSRDKPVVHRVRAIVNSGRREYDPIEVAFSTPEKRDYILAEALRQLRALKRRYSSLSELAVVFTAFDQVEKRVQRKRA